MPAAGATATPNEGVIPGSAIPLPPLVSTPTPGAPATGETLVPGSGTTLPPLVTASEAVWTGQTTTGEFARVTGDDEPDFEFGPLTVLGAILGRGFDLTAALRSSYNDNILRLGEGRLARPGASKDDFKFSPTITGRIGQPLGRQQLFASLQFGKDYYARNERLNRTRLLGNAGINLRAGANCTGVAAVVYSRRLNTLDEASSEELQEANVIERQSYNASAQCAGVVGLGYGASFDRTIRENSRATRATFDSRSTSGGARVFYSFPTLGTISLNGNYTEISYPNRPPVAVVFIDVPPFIILQPVADGVKLWTGAVNYSRAIGARLNISIGISYNDVDSTSSQGFPVTGDFSGFGYNGSLSYRPSERLSVQVDGGRSVTSTSTVGAAFVINDRLGANFNYRINPSWSASLAASANKRDYRGEFSVDQVSDARANQTTYRAAAGLTFQPNRIFDVDFDLSYRKRDAELADPNALSRDYSGTVAAITLRARL